MKTNGWHTYMENWKRSLRLHWPDICIRAQSAGRRVAAWIDAKESLDGWRLPESGAARWNLRPVVTWGIAAALLLAAGIAIGSLSSPRRAGRATS